MIEFGQQNPGVVMLFHGGGLSWWNYREVANLLAERYHVVLPVLDGHADSDAPFTTIEDNANRLISYIDNHFGGQVLAIGGLKEKTLAAYRSGINTVLIPEDNLRDLDDIDSEAKEHLSFIPCKNASDVLSAVLCR